MSAIDCTEIFWLRFYLNIHDVRHVTRITSSCVSQTRNVTDVFFFCHHGERGSILQFKYLSISSWIINFHFSNVTVN